jgi:glycosyltransferase involved in cell wall biosynthesis
VNRIAVDQFSPWVQEGDAIGNEVLSLRSMLRAHRFPAAIYAEVPSPIGGLHIRPWKDYRGRASDLLIVHYGICSPLFDPVLAANSRKVLLYHNVTRPAFMEGIPGELRDRLLEARDKLALYRDSVELALADSEYSSSDLTDAGFPNVRVFPYVLSQGNYAVWPNAAVLERYRGDGMTNLLVVGRIAPNKCIEDCILTFHYFHSWIEPNSRLFIVGNSTGMECYLLRLERLVRRLGLGGSVVFTGRVSQAALNAYYRLGAALLVMSEHEGFCVPPIEAMLFELPVFAYAACATPETMRGSGVLFPEKNHSEIAETIGVMLSDSVLRERIVSTQREAAAFYSASAAEHRLSELLTSLGV